MAQQSDIDLLRHWDSQPHVIASDPNGDWDWEFELSKQPRWRKMLIAQWNERPIGFIQIIDPALEESNYWNIRIPGFRAIDIWIGEAHDLNKGYGTAIMKSVIHQCFQDPNVQTILVDPLSSNIDAHRFYERLGFLQQGEEVLDGDLCYVYKLNRTD